MNAAFLYRHLAIGALMFASHAAAAKTLTYIYTEILPPGSVQTVPIALDKSGVVLGYWLDSTYADHGFTYENGTYTNIDYPGAIYTQPSGFNEKGEIVGSYTDTSHLVHAFLFKNGKFKTIVAPGATNTEFTGINRSGSAGGYSSAGTGSAFVYKNGIFTTINAQDYVAPVAINNAGSVIGDYFPPEPQPITAWLYANGTLTTLPVQSDDVEVTAMNSSNEVVGSQTVGSTFEAFLYGANGQVTSIAYPTATGTYGEGISDKGDITGYYTDASYTEYGFVLSKGKFVSLSAPNAAGTYGLTINDVGQVLGGYHDSNRVQYTFLATPSH